MLLEPVFKTPGFADASKNASPPDETWASAEPTWLPLTFKTTLRRSVLLAEPITLKLRALSQDLLFVTVKLKAPTKLLLVPAVTSVPIEEEATVMEANDGFDTVVTVKVLPFKGNAPAATTALFEASTETTCPAALMPKPTVLPAERPVAGSI